MKKTFITLSGLMNLAVLLFLLSNLRKCDRDLIRKEAATAIPLQWLIAKYERIHGHYPEAEKDLKSIDPEGAVLNSSDWWYAQTESGYCLWQRFNGGVQIFTYKDKPPVIFHVTGDDSGEGKQNKEIVPFTEN
jgi:hypothetical protein